MDPEATIIVSEAGSGPQPAVPAGSADPDAKVAYVFGSEIARGGMGSILEAQDCKIGRTVAVKIMLSEMGADADQKQRFINEAAVLGMLAHPNIVPVYDIGRDPEGHLYYSMKLVKGRTLQTILNDIRDEVPKVAKHYTLDRLLTIFRKVCDALAFAHSKGVIHRDLKPENVMVGEFGEVLVMDWGLAKNVKDGVSAADKNASGGSRAELASFGATLQGTVMGTPQYMSPEQAQGSVTDMDARSDIFSLGGILYAILTLRPPVEGSTLEEVLRKVSSGSITPPSAFGGTTRKRTPGVKGEVLEAKKIKPLPHCPGGRVPAALSSVAMKALTVRREQRYQDVAAFSADIEAYQNGFATGAEQAGKWKRFTLFVKRHKAASIGVAAVLVLSVAFTAKVIGERNRAERTLGELRGTAPTFEAQSRALLAEGKLEDALAKLGYAVQLAPENADYRLARAHLLQSTQQLAAAAAEYRAVLALRPGDAAAKANLDLCATLLAERGGAAELPLKLQGKLLDALIAQQRDLEAAPLAKLLKRDTETAKATILARLAAYTTQKDWNTNRIQRGGKGFMVNLSALQLGDLNALRGLPIVDLRLSSTSVTDLRPLAGLPLESLWLNGTPVSDLSPLRGMKLSKLDIANTGVADLSPLAGMPLKDLNLSNNKNLHDIKPLTGLPLEKLNAGAIPNTDISALRGMPLIEVTLTSGYTNATIQDYSPLAHSPTMEKIGLNENITDIAFLATMPKLKQVDYRRGKTVPVWIPARDFLAMYGPDVPEIKAARAALATAGVKDLPIWKVAVDPDHQLRLDLHSTPLTDLTPLRGLPIKMLDLWQTGVSELEPLRGMPLQGLNLGQTKVRDLDPLRGMPLVKVNLVSTGTRDLSVLADCPDLEEIYLPPNATNVERLRTLPKLRYISTRWNTTTDHPAQTAEEFWKEYDAQQAAGKK